MIPLLCLYEFNEKNFTTNGLATLNNAAEVLISQAINGDYRVSFQFPLTDEKAALIQVNRLIRCEGQIFRIAKVTKLNDGKQTAAVEALHIYFDNEKHHIQRMYDHTGTTPYDEISKAFADTDFTVLSPEQAESLGMRWVDVRIDFFQSSKTTPCEVVRTAIESAGVGELYIDNYNIALVYEIGADNGVRLSMGQNMQAVTRDESIFEFCTRLYPYGKNDLHIESVNGGEQYIDSPNIEIYGRRDLHIEYSTIEDPALLLSRARWNFDSENPERIDIPAVTYEGKIIDLFKLEDYGDRFKINLGDTVKINDTATGADEKKRIIKLDRYPYQPSESAAVIGSMKKDLFYYLNKFNRLEGKVIKIETGEDKVFYNTIVEVTREKILAAEVIDATTAFFHKAFVQTLETNLTPFLCKPNLVQSNGVYQWRDAAHTYNCQTSAPYGDIWPLITLNGINQKFIERHLVPGGLDALGTSQIQPLVIDGAQMYYTSLTDFQYLTYVRPRDKYPDMTAENAEMFTVYVRKVQSEYTKADFDLKKETAGGSETYTVDFSLGAGDGEAGGRMHIRKLEDGGYITYTSRTTGAEMGISIKDDGVWYFDAVTGKWALMGSGSSAGSQHIMIDHQPTQAEIDVYAAGDLVLVYDGQTPYVPVG